MNRKTPLRSNTPLKRSQLRRQSAKQRRRQAEFSGMNAKLRAERGNKCEVCQSLPWIHKHHRRLRSQGGTDDYSNILLCCTSCHDAIHRNPAWAAEHGYIEMRKA